MAGNSEKLKRTFGKHHISVYLKHMQAEKEELLSLHLCLPLFHICILCLLPQTEETTLMSSEKFLPNEK